MQQCCIIDFTQLETKFFKGKIFIVRRPIQLEGIVSLKDYMREYLLGKIFDYHGHLISCRICVSLI